MKLSFSLPSKSSSRPSKPSLKFDQDQAAKGEAAEFHYVTEFDSSKTLMEAPKLIIPPKENTWCPPKKMRNIDLPMEDKSGHSPVLFELEDTSASSADKPDISYGLNLRSHDNNDQKKPPAPASNNSIENIMLEKFHQDMKSLPDDRGFDEFEAVPVESFGAALLAGYGWSEGKGIGRNAKEDVKVVQYVRRKNREGLGFVPEEHDKKKKVHNSDRPDTTVLVAPKGTGGRIRHVVGIDEKLVPREPKGIVVGKVVRIIGGIHTGLKGQVVEILNSDSRNSSVVLKLVKSEEEVFVGFDEVAELGSIEEERCSRKLQELNVNGKESSDWSDKRKERERREEHEQDDRAPVTWLRSHIRVREVSKTFKGGKLYLKKEEAIDVVGPYTCDISMDESKEFIQGVDQDNLETALPKKGGPVLVLFGKHKRVFENLVERNVDKEIGIIRDADGQAFLTVCLVQIAEYIRDPNYLGY
ncbi:protein MOS2-like [Aristolochia californica]|uniref:protein MOS2-like n=1 Tax=Aristolochia californica TaxID=171875 RepID=UPI0035DD3916